MATIHSVKPRRAGVRYPEGLTSKRVRDFYKHVITEFILEPHHVTLLEEAAFSLQRAEQARMAVACEGLTYTVGDKVHQHPMLSVERDSRTLFCRLCRELGLDLAEADTARPAFSRQGKKVR